jgi:acyl carrier protein
LKELIVVRGRILFPQDIERVIADCPGGMQGAASAVFSVELLGSERLVVVQEFARTDRHLDFDRIGSEIRRAVGRECGIEVFDLLFVREGSIPRTTSGKTQRLQCREDYLAERFDPAARWTDRHHLLDAGALSSTTDVDSAAQTRSVDEIRDWLLRRIVARLDVPAEQLNQDQAFSEMGLGSLDVVLICDDFENWLGTRLAPTTLFNYPTIASLAEHLGQPETLPIVSLAKELPRDRLREEIERWTPDELEAFVAQEAAKWASQTHGRAA